MRLVQIPTYGNTYSFYAFYLRFDECIGSVSILEPDVSAPTEAMSKYDILCLAFLYQQESSPKVFNSLKHFGAQIPYLLSKLENLFYSYSHSQTLPRSLQLL